MTGGFDHHVNAEISPRQRGRVPLGQHPDGVIADPDHVAISPHVLVQGAQQRVVFQQMRAGSKVAQVIRGDDVDSAVTCGMNGSPEVPADPAEPIDSHPDCHCSALLQL